MLKKIKNKKASITTITLFAIMCFLFPMLGIIYDIGLLHIYKQDLKNIQDLSGTACTPVTEGKGLSNDCENIARAYALINITGDIKYANGVGKLPTGGQNASEIEKIKKFRNIPNLKNCNVDKKSRICITDGEKLDVHVTPVSNHVGGNNIRVQIRNLNYRPMFLTGTLFAFAGTKNYNMQDKVYSIDVPASTFSATYSYNKKKQ